MTIPRTLAAALVATAIAAPAASAQPVDTPVGSPQPQLQDLRGERARDAAIHPGDAPRLRQDLRGEHARDAFLRPEDAPPGRSFLVPFSGPASPGHPSEAANTTPLAPAADEPLSASGGGVDWATLGLGITGLMLFMGGVIALATRTRPVPRPRSGV
jgi:hypothetical protein